jgi:large subunit ribosomal protein L30
MATITVTLAKSRHGCAPKQRATLAALGLKKIRQERSFEKTDSVVGMIAKVKHLVEVTES